MIYSAGVCGYSSRRDSWYDNTLNVSSPSSRKLPKLTFETDLGHYVSYQKHPLSGGWRKCNDAYVTKVDIEKVMRTEPYMLIYRRQNTQVLF